jgi:hypothetical protein
VTDAVTIQEENGVVVVQEVVPQIIEVIQAGPQGASGTSTIGTITTGLPGTAANITNSGTPSQAVLNFTIPRGDTGDVTPAATAAKVAAEAAATAAASSQTAAAGSASSASTSQAAAASSAASAETSALAATTQASNALFSASNAEGFVSAAAESAATALVQATTATTQASLADTSAINANESAATARDKASEAVDSAMSAAGSEANAASSASTATIQANIATTKASEATASASAASGSAAAALASQNASASSAEAALSAITIAGGYQPLLGYTAANKAGETFTGAVLTSNAGGFTANSAAKLWTDSGRGRIDLWEGSAQTKSFLLLNTNAGGRIGMVSNEQLEFVTNNIARLTIAASGAAVFGVSSTVRSSNESNGTLLSTQNTNASNATQFFVSHNGSLVNLGNARAGGLALWANGTAHVQLTAAGFVGIGKDVPSGPLHVKGANGIYVEGAVNTNVGRMVMTGSQNEILAVGLNGVYTNGRVKLGAGAITPANGGWIDSFADGQHLFYGPSSTEIARFTAAGFLGIGTATPSNKLTVQGAIDTYAQIATTATDGISGVVLLNDARSWVLRNNGINGDTFEIRDATANAQRLSIDIAGNLIQLAPATPPTLSTNGTLVFNLTSNTNLRVSVRGSDGVTRTGTIALA